MMPYKHPHLPATSSPHHALPEPAMALPTPYWWILIGFGLMLWLSGNTPFPQPTLFSNSRITNSSVSAVRTGTAPDRPTSSFGRSDDAVSEAPSTIHASVPPPMNISLLTPSEPEPEVQFRNLTFLLSPDYASRKGIPTHLVELKRQKCLNYMKRFGPIARQEMELYGIPASIKLAQGLLESDVGESTLATDNRNHFGIKCFSKTCSKGHCSNHNDDSHKDFFRIYSSAWESYRAHSQFLQQDRYRHLRRLAENDYKGWAHGLKNAGYATDPAYPDKLIAIIEGLGLQDWDQ